MPTPRLASVALQALSVDAELSPLVRRTFSLASPRRTAVADNGIANGDDEVTDTILRTHYRATTNRMLRVAVNGFMENIGVILQVMEELDVDVLDSTLRSAV